MGGNSFAGKGTLLGDAISGHTGGHSHDHDHGIHEAPDATFVGGKQEDLVICMDQIKMGVIAKTVIFPVSQNPFYNVPYS